MGPIRCSMKRVLQLLVEYERHGISVPIVPFYLVVHMS
jgi:hypothetical protein